MSVPQCLRWTRRVWVLQYGGTAHVLHGFPTRLLDERCLSKVMAQSVKAGCANLAS